MDPERMSVQSANSPEGRYVNYFKIGHNAFEFIIDCGQCYAENEERQLHTRIITSPAYGKALLKTLRDSLEDYEKNYGRVERMIAESGYWPMFAALKSSCNLVDRLSRKNEGRVP